MAEEVSNPYVQTRNGTFYVLGSRVSLASIVYAFRQGASPEAILQDFPSIGSLARVYGAIAFILENPELVETYLQEQESLWNELERAYPLTREMAIRNNGRENC